MSTMFLKVIRALTFAGTVALAPWANAQDAWPKDTITWVAVTAPGGNSDVLARLIGQPLSEKLGVSVVVENRPGAGGIVAGSYVLSSPADGYKLFGGGSAANVISPLTNANIPYDVQKDFAPVTLLGVNYNVLVVPADSPFKTVADIVAEAKKNPRSVSYASPAIGGSQHMSGELLKQLAGIDLVHTPNSRGAAIMDVIGGHVSMMFEGPAAMTHIQSGAVRALAVTSKTRLPQLPDVPTMEEAGVPGFEVMAWQGIFVKAGTPEAVIDRLQKEVKAIIETPAMRERLEKMGLKPSGMTPAELVAFQKAETDKWATVVEAAGLRKQ